jgi:spore coat protein U-like protein
MTRAFMHVVLGAAALLLACARPADAACTVSTTSVAFGTYDVFAATATDSTGVVSVRCDTRTTLSVQVGKGAAPTFLPRTLKQATTSLNYNLYQDSARTVVWGDGTGGTSAFSVTVNANVTRNQTLFARVPANQDVPAGAYTDTVVVTIVF